MQFNQIEEAYKLAVPIPQNHTADDTCCAFIIQYFPDFGDGGSTWGVLYSNAATMTFTVDGAAPAGGDMITSTASSATPGMIDLSSASMNTLGEVQDCVNGWAAWKMILCTALRADSVGFILNQTSAPAADIGLPFYFDSSASAVVGACITGDAFVNSGKAGFVTDEEDACVNELLYLKVQITQASLGCAVKFYSGKFGQTEVQIGSSYTTASATAKEFGEANWTMPYVQSIRGERLVVRWDSDSGVTNTHAPGTTVFNMIGRTAVLGGGRLVSAKNF